MNGMRRTANGFTLVELLIVIVVIAILAAVSVVAYNGTQDRANFSVMRADIASIQKAIEMYKSIHGTYPNSIDCTYHQYGWCGWNQGKNDALVPGLVPELMSTTPTLDTSRAHADSYLYQSRAANCSHEGSDAYQLIRYNSTGLNSAELSDDNPMKITGSGYDGIAWGVKSPNCSAWW